MRILEEPKVYLLLRPQLVHEGLRDFLTDNDLRWPTPMEGTDAATGIECAGRGCYMSFGEKAGSKSNQEYINNLLGRDASGAFVSEGPAHGSVVEHPTWTFIVTGAGRGFSHEQVRHRVGWAYSQLSTRYCDFEREDSEGTWDPGFVIPPLAQLSETTRNQFEYGLREAQRQYTSVLHKIEVDLQSNKKFMKGLSKYPEKDRARMLRKAARGAARDILPIATEAIMTMSAHARAIWNCIYLRGSEHAEAPIRSVYVQLARIMERELPEVFYGIEYKTLWDGSTAVVLPRDKLFSILSRAEWSTAPVPPSLLIAISVAW